MENVIPISAAPAATRLPAQVSFNRQELMTILDLYGRMVAAGLWRDYALDMDRQQATFSAFRRTAERPDFRIVKRPDLARRQGAYALVGQNGSVLRRGHDLGSVLRLLHARLIKLVDCPA